MGNTSDVGDSVSSWWEDEPRPPRVGPRPVVRRVPAEGRSEERRPEHRLSEERQPRRRPRRGRRQRRQRVERPDDEDDVLLRSRRVTAQIWRSFEELQRLMEEATSRQVVRLARSQRRELLDRLEQISQEIGRYQNQLERRRNRDAWMRKFNKK